ncbi:MAG: hypothetical protein IPK86_00220 [Neisseriales bacterium]|nr:MAG: hypothetical protein IPK86_00220 [Neisseriales bacterium]
MSTNHILGWVRNSWTLFRQYPLKWIVLLLIFLFLNSLTLNLANPLFVAGIAFACQQQHETGKLKITFLFTGFCQATRQLIYLCLIYIAALVIFYVAVELPIRFYVTHYSGSTSLFWLLLLVWQLLCCASFLASTLVLLQHQTAAQATKRALVTMINHAGSLLALNLALSVAIYLALTGMQTLVHRTPFIWFMILIGGSCVALILFFHALYYAHRDWVLDVQ